MRTVTGVIELPSSLSRSLSATAYVRVEEVTYVDRPAKRLGEATLSDIADVDIERGFVRFEVTVADPQDRATCTVRAHLDLDGDGLVSRGDWVSTEHTPVLGADDPREIMIKLRRVE
jgi:hypothetical protein